MIILLLLSQKIARRPLASYALLLLLGGLIQACDGRPSSSLTAPPAIVQEDVIAGPKLKIDFNPKLVFLFVIDPSVSMQEEQNLMVAAADQFADGFDRNSLLTYRVGVITAYDSRTQNRLKADGMCRLAGASEEQNKDKADCSPPGQLRSPFYSSSNPNKEELRNALKVGTLTTALGGPRFEEIFTPIIAATSPEMNAINGNFIEPDARVVIIVLTDEGDLSPDLGVDSFLSQLDQNLGLDRVDLYGVLSTNKCSRNSYATLPTRVRQAISMAHGSTENRIFSICDSSYGQHLASIGSAIRAKVQSTEIKLDAVPEDKTLVLSYGGHPVEPGPGWGYNPETGILSINSRIHLPIAYDPQAEFSVSYLRVSQRTIQRGHAKPLF